MKTPRPVKGKDVPANRQEWSDLLSQRIDESGLTGQKFAELVLTRDGRTLRRWLSGESPIPNHVRDFLLDPWEIPWPRFK